METFIYYSVEYGKINFRPTGQLAQRKNIYAVIDKVENPEAKRGTEQSCEYEPKFVQQFE